eukprot:10333737-Heterocapsa_arctica.AAC.1
MAGAPPPEVEPSSPPAPSPRAHPCRLVVAAGRGSAAGVCSPTLARAASSSGSRTNHARADDTSAHRGSRRRRQPRRVPHWLPVCPSTGLEAHGPPFCVGAL